MLLLAFSASAAMPTVGVRLQSGLTSYTSKKDDVFRSVVVSPLEIGGQTLIPAGAVVYGRVRRARGVGIGLVHERALLDLEFAQYELPDGQTIPFSAKLLNVDNARESVGSDGKIRGILAAGGPTMFWRRFWLTPSSDVLHRTAGGMAGITGFTGSLWSEATFGPAYAVGLMALRWTVLRFPEPEIVLPAGVDLTLAVSSVPEDAPRYETAQTALDTSAAGAALAESPHQIYRPNRKPADDITNVAFAGSSAKLASAFSAAGWNRAEMLNRRTFSHLYHAYVSMQGYATAPVSRLLYEGREPDLVFEKNLNTVGRRHHIRIWKIPGQDLWVGAATHDAGLTLGRKLQLTHKIDPRIDLERTKVVEDLTAAECVAQHTFVARPGAIRDGSSGIFTDGQMSLVRLQGCLRPQIWEIAPFRQPGSRLSRLTRRVLLESRHYVLRDNMWSYGYRGLRLLYRKL